MGSASMDKSADQSWLRVIHASADAPAVDVWVDGQRAVRHLVFGETSAYSRLAPGMHQIAVVPAGETSPIVLMGHVNLTAGMGHSVFALGSVENLTALGVVDNPMKTQAHVRFVHASADAPAVDVAPAGGEAIFSGVTYGEATDYLALPAGSYDLEARVAGTDTVALEVPDVQLEAGMSYTAVALGSATDGSLQVILTKDQ